MTTKVNIGKTVAPPPPEDDVRIIGDVHVKSLDAEQMRFEVTDSLGRKIEVHKLSEVERFDLYEVFGSDNPNAYTMSMSAIAATVRSIRDKGAQPEGFVFPKNKKHVRAIIARLGSVGMDAIRAAFAPKPEEDTETVQEAPPADPTTALAKN